MNLEDALLLLFTHGLPILFFAYMATDVLLRNFRKVEHILLSLIAICYLLLFAEEYVRNQVSIAYSPLLSSLWLSSVGIIIPGLCFHFLIKFTSLDAGLSRWFYPWVFYLPLLFVAVNLATGAQLISAQQFVEAGMWKLPVYNEGYYIAMTSSVFMDLLFLIPLLIAISKARTQEQRSIYKQLIWGISISIVWHAIFGYINFGDSLPPYPYLYSGILWCYFLRRTMRKHDFLNLYDKRFEKLYNLNPDAIVLVNLKGNVKTANPGAKRFFDSIRVEPDRCLQLLNHEITTRIHAQLAVKQMETEIETNAGRMALLVNADYVWVDNELHILLILRDITFQKQQQDEIRFLAYHDPLTRLPNRRYFYEKLEEALEEASTHQETLALLLIDLDQLKWLNDNRGHLAGDDALRQAARIMQQVVADRGVAARMGGDEFILIIRHSPAVREIQTLIQHMQDEFNRYTAPYGTLPVGISIGASYYPADGTDGQALINAADNAMFEMKRSRATV
ncbi:GGDEF domain-containing protein [Paenibacillus chungangensis]|uniref:GGDEF domain-containing protein n=1 Tax=Paenibacillus chungangensis TaxID=696535 RepID=A0ABW3HRH1_9BACL